MKQKKTTPLREPEKTSGGLAGFPTQEELDEDLESLDRALKTAAQRQAAQEAAQKAATQQAATQQKAAQRRPLPNQGAGAADQSPVSGKRTAADQTKKTEAETANGRVIRQHVPTPAQLQTEAELATASSVETELDEDALHETAAGVKMLGWVFRKVKGQSEVTVVTAAESADDVQEAAEPQASAPAPKAAAQSTEEAPAVIKAAASTEEEPAQVPVTPPAKTASRTPSKAEEQRPAANAEAAKAKKQTAPAIDPGPEPLPIRPRRLREPEPTEEEAPEPTSETPKKKRHRWPFGRVKAKSSKYADSLFVGDEILQGTDLTNEEQREARQEELRRRGLAGPVPDSSDEDVYVDVEDPDTWEEEELEEEEHKKPRRQKVHIPLPDIAPRTLATIYSDGVAKQWSNTMLSLLICIPLLYVNLADSLNLPIFSALWDDKLAAAVVLEGLGLVTLLLCHVFGDGIGDLFRGKWGLHTLTSLAVLLTLLDGVYFVFLGREGPMPCGGVAALCLTFTSLGQCQKKRAQQMSCRSAAMTDTPTRLVMERDEGGELTQVMLTLPGDNQQFGSQIQEPDGVEQMSRPIVLVLMIGGMVFSLLAAVGSGAPDRVLWCASIIFTMASPLSATLAYGMPYLRITRKLNESGAALAGWEGVEEIGRCRRVVIGDNDLFPVGRISCHGLHLYGRAAIDIVSGYANAMVKASGSGMARAFSELAISLNANDWGVQNFQMYHGGGCSGIIRNDEVLFGSAAFMKMMKVPMPEESFVKTAVFCAINGELAGQIVLNYKLPGYVLPAMNTLQRNRLTPVMCLRDVVLTPEVLKQKFGMNLSKAEFPSMDDRILLTTPELAESSKLSALLGREGLAVHADAIVGGKRLYKAALKNGRFALLASVLGMLMGFYLTFMGAFTALQPENILVFLLLWTVPVLLISLYVDRY